jgi:hypothetical protein
MKEFDFNDKQLLIRDAVRRMDPLHQHWKVLEGLFRTGLRRDLNARDFADLTPTPIPGNVLKTINMVLPHISLMTTSIVSRDPQLIVTPIGGPSADVEDNADFAKAVLDYFWRRTAATDDVKAATEDMLKLGNGFVKVGWEYIASELKEDPEVILDETMIAVDRAEATGEDGGFAPETQNTQAKAAFTYEKVEVDDPFVEYVSPYDMFCPKDARRMDTVRWVAHRLRLPVEDLKSRFGEDAPISVDAAVASDALISTYNNVSNNLPEVLSYAVIYEFYDMATRTLTVFQIDGSEALFEGPIPYQHRYPPFVHFRNYNDGGMQFWSFGDLENIAGLQLMLGEVTRAQIDDLKRVGNKYAIRKRNVTPEVKKQLESPIPDQVIVFDVPETTALSDVVVPLNRQSTPADNFNMDAKLQDAMQKVLGINDFQAGGLGTSRMSATAAAVVDGVATLRAQDKLAAVETGVSSIGLRILLLCQEFLDESRAIRIAGPGGAAWLSVSASDIYGEFKVNVEGGSTRALNPATRAQRGIQTLQTVIPVLTQLGYDPTNAVRMALRDMGYDPNYLLVKETPEAAPEEAMAAEMTPEDMALQEQALAQMQAPQPTAEDLIAALGAQAPAPAPAEAVAQEFGGPGVPGATTGNLAL